MTTINRIGLPPRTQFVALFRHNTGWHAWTAVRDPQLPLEQWQGTYLFLQDDGGIIRVTVYDDGHEETMIVR